MQKQISIESATIDQLRAFADSIGVTLSHNPDTKRETIVARIKAVWDKDYIVISDAADLEVKVASNAEKMISITIQTAEGDGGDQPIFVNVNDRRMLIPRGERVTVPAPFVGVLKNAVQFVYDPLKGGGISTTPRKVQRFPFTIHEPA